MELEIVKKLENIDLKKTERKIWMGITSIFGAYLFVSLLNKFVNDNWSFRIKRISNLPPKTTTTDNQSTQQLHS